MIVFSGMELLAAHPVLHPRLHLQPPLRNASRHGGLFSIWRHARFESPADTSIVQQMSGEFLAIRIKADALLDQATGIRGAKAGVIHIERRLPIAVRSKTYQTRQVARAARIAVEMRAERAAIVVAAVELMA